MVKKSTWITGLVMILVAVLTVGVFCAPQASAAEIDYGSANTAAMPQEAKDLQNRVKTIDPTATCPVCNKAVTWTSAAGDKAYSVTTGELHLKISGKVTATKSWPLEFLGNGGKIHIYLDNADWTLPALNGPILINSGKNNNELAIFGTGKIHSETTGYSLISIAGQGNKIYLLGGEYTTASTTKAVIGVRTVTGRNEVHIFEGATIGRAVDAESVSQNVVLENTKLNMYGGTIRNGYRNALGGNVYLNATCEFNMYGGTITSGYALNTANSDVYGGNLYSSGAPVNLYGGTITGGESYYGGNICVLSGAELSVSGTALISDGKALNLTDESGNVKSGYAGNVFVGSDCSLTMTGGKITGGANTGGPASATAGVSSDYGNGGNLVISGATFNMSNGVISDGSSPNGGNVQIIGAKSDAHISGGTISGGRAKWGGGIYMANGKLTVSGGTITGASAAFRGGNVYIEGATTTNITGGTISKGTVDAASSSVDRTGGNIYMAGTGKLTISGGTITSGEAMEGGNLFARKGTVEITDVAKIRDGYGIFRGGNLYVKEAAVSIAGGRVSGGQAPDGGNVFVESGSFTVSDGVITGGQAYYDNEPEYSGSTVVVLGSQYKGGNIYAMADIAITGGTISNGESLNSWGGNIFVKECELTVSGGVITGGKALNTSDGRGGNIAAENAVVSISGKASVQDGKAAEGGNIYIEVGASQLNVSGGTITGGKAIYGGNAYLASEMIAKITGGTITEGVAELGGNIYVAYNGKLHQTAGTISGGIAQKVGSTGGDIDFDDLVNNPGGADINPEGIYTGAEVYLYDADYIMQGGNIVATAGQAASAVYAHNGRVYLEKGATVSNGNIKIAEEGKLFVGNTWKGSAAVVFPRTYASGNEVDTKWAANGDVTVSEDLTVKFTPGGTFSGTLHQGVEPFASIQATGNGGKLRVGTASYAAYIKETGFTTLEQAIAASQSGDIIVLAADCTIEEDLYLKKGRTLDLNGYTLSASGEVTAANKTTHIIDSSNGDGVLVTEKAKVAFNRQNSYLPVWVKGEGFHFANHEFTLSHKTAETHPNDEIDEGAVKLRFWLDGTADSFLAQQLANGGADNDVKIKIKLAWTNSQGVACEQFFTFPEANVMKYASDDVWEKGALYLIVKNALGVKDLRFTAMLVYDDAVQVESAVYSIS